MKDIMKSPLFKPFFIILVLVGALDLVATYLHLFDTIMWFDMIMHFSGGFFISSAVLLIFTRKFDRTFSYGELLLWGLGSAVVIGVLWECFELYFGITYFWSPSYWGDNGMDVTMDTFGGLIAVWYSYYTLTTNA